MRQTVSKVGRSVTVAIVFLCFLTLQAESFAQG